MYEFVCNNNVKMFSEVEIPTNNEGRFKGNINRRSMVGMCFDVEYYNEIYNNIEIIKYIPGNNPKFEVKYNDKIKEMQCGGFLNGKIGTLLNETVWIDGYICNNRGDKILSKIPMHKCGRYRNKIDFKSMVGMVLEIEYKGEIYNNIKILKYNNNKFKVKYNDMEINILCSHFMECKLGALLRQINYGHIYNVGDIVNNLEIIECGRMDKFNKHSPRAYKIKCLKCGFDSGEHYKNGKLVEEYWIQEYVLKAGCGCPCCCTPTKITVLGINSIYDTHKYLVNDFKLEEFFAKTHSYGTSKKGNFLCNNCGNVKYKSISDVIRRGTISCDCNDFTTYSEKIMIGLLKQLDIEFKTEYSPKWISPKRYDFYIPSLNMIIETHGIQHYEESPRGRSLKEEQENDKLKKELALKNGIENYIVIDCRYSNTEYIRANILNSDLMNYFNLNKINWNKCEEFAVFKNIVKEVCEYWNKKEEWETTTSVGIKFNKDRHTILKYIKLGSKFNWCKYIDKEEYENNMCNEICSIVENNEDVCISDITKITNYSYQTVVKYANMSGYDIKTKTKEREDIFYDVCKYKNEHKDTTCREISEIFNIGRGTASKYLRKGENMKLCTYDPSYGRSVVLREAKRKPVEIFKDGVSLGVFESATELERCSEEVFGEKLLKSKICSVAKEKRKTHKGYTFKYIEDNKQSAQYI